MHKEGRKTFYKRLLISIICIVLVLALVIGILFVVRNRTGGTIDVYPVWYFATSGAYAYETETDGVVTADKIQSVYVSSTQQVTEIYVEEGQTVEVGDPILAYDTTLSQVELDRQAIAVQQLELELENEEKNLATISSYKIGSGGGYTYYSSSSSSSLTSVGVPYFKGGSGTASDPYVWLWSESIEYTDAVIQMILNPPIQSNDGSKDDEDEPDDIDEPEDMPNQEEDDNQGEPTDPEDDANPLDTTVPEDDGAQQDTTVPEDDGTQQDTTVPEDDAAQEETTAPEENNVQENIVEPEDVEPEETVVPEENNAEEETPVQEENSTAENSNASEEANDPEENFNGETVTHNEANTAEEPETPVEEVDDGRIYVVFELRESNAPKGMLNYCWEMAFREITTTVTVENDSGTADADDDEANEADESSGSSTVVSSSWVFSIIEPNYVADESEEEDSISIYVDNSVYYSASEVAQLKSESQQRISDLTLQLKMAQLEYDQLEYELSNGVVYATVAGTVKTVRDPDTALEENSPVVLVSGGGGYYVTGVLGEFDLDTMAIGDMVQVYSWQSGGLMYGTITEISEYPSDSDEYWYYTDGNSNVSLYPFTVMLDEDSNLREGEYVDIYLANSGWDDDGSLYLYNPFVRTEGGKSYIWIANEDGLLEKRYVNTGMSLWGSYTQIIDGLTEDDYIAFPYSKNLREGVTVNYSDDIDSLYGY